MAGEGVGKGGREDDKDGKDSGMQTIGDLKLPQPRHAVENGLTGGVLWILPKIPP